jgi:hypothetical protein
LCDALGACTDLKPVYRRLLKMALEQLHQDAVQRLAEVPGFGVDSAQQIIAEVGPTAATFPSEKCLSSWVGACPGDDESAGVNHSHRSPKGNRHMRRILNQSANAAVKAKGSIFEIAYRRTVPRLGHKQSIGAVAHRQCRLIWLILRQGVRGQGNWRTLTRPREKDSRAGPTYNRLNREKEGRREGGGRVWSSDELGNSQGAKEPKTLGNLQDLRQRIYRKGKTEAGGWCGVDARDIPGSKAPPTGYVP